MSRDELKKAVKALLDEISPFDEPDEFIEGVDDESFASVKPIDSYIESELDNAARYCLNTLPLSMLSLDIESEPMSVAVGDDGVGRTEDTIEESRRFVRVSVPGYWERDVNSFITTSSPMYVLQQNKYTRGGACKPVVVYNPEDRVLELYSFGSGAAGSTIDANLWSIYTEDVKACCIESAIGEYIALRCAAAVSEILGSQNSDVFMKEFANKLNSILK